MKTLNKKIIFSFIGVSLLVFFFYLLGYDFVFAQEKDSYSPLVELPGLDSNQTSIPDFINTVYQITVALGAVLGVIKIAFAGVKYSMSDVITDKASAKNDILGVLLGLAVLLIPFIVLNTIYPGLVNLDFVKGIRDQNVKLGDATFLPQENCSVFAHSSIESFQRQCRQECYDNWIEKGIDSSILDINQIIVGRIEYNSPPYSRSTCDYSYIDKGSGSGNETRNDCESNDETRWDPICNYCIPKTEVDGEICETLPEESEQSLISCEDAGFDTSDLEEAGDCITWCADQGGVVDPFAEVLVCDLEPS